MGFIAGSNYFGVLAQQQRNGNSSTHRCRQLNLILAVCDTIRRKYQF